MGIFSCFSSNQARYDVRVEMIQRALDARREAQPLFDNPATQTFSHLQRSSPASSASSAPAPVSIPRSPSMDFLDFDKDLSTWKNVGPSSQQEDRQVAARQLRNAKRLREGSLTLQNLDLDDLPACLAALPNLTQLELRQCRIGQLQALPPNLQKLDAIGAGLTRLPALPDSLLELTIHYNKLESLPELPTNLRVLLSNNNRLKTLPALPSGLEQLFVTDNRLPGLPPLPPGLCELGVAHNFLKVLPRIPASCYMVEAHHNRLTDVPPSAYEMDYLEWVSVQDNPIPTSVLDRIRAGIEKRTDGAVMYVDSEISPDGYRHCSGKFEATSLEPGLVIPTPPLVAAVMSWYDRMPASADGRDRRKADWEIVHYAVPEDSEFHPSEDLATFLNRLCETAEYKDRRQRPELTARVCRLLDSLIDDATLRERCYALSTEALSRCQDRIAVGLDQMEVAVLSAQASTGVLDMEELRALGIGMLKLSELETICEELTELHPMIDSVELLLALRIRFASLLDLPVSTKQMQYEPPKEIKADQWSAAYDRVVNAASDPERQIAFLAQWKPWQVGLERRGFPQLVAAVEEKSRREQGLQEELDTVMDRLAELECASENLSEAYFDLHADIARINLAFTRLEQEVIDPIRMQLTRVLLTTKLEPFAVQHKPNNEMNLNFLEA